MKDFLDQDLSRYGGKDRCAERDASAMLAMFAPLGSLHGRPAAALSGRIPVGQAPVYKMPVPVASAARRGTYDRLGKRVLDILLVLLSAPVTLFVLAVCALALWIEGGNPFYRQIRLGAGGKRFSILKLRTMVRDADTALAGYLAADPALRLEWETTQKLKRDPRITRVGAILRSTSLDELPQFWNVLTGEMSLVGPRPMLPEQLELYGDPAPYFALRPGITGFWQVSARNESHFSFRAEIDAQYLRRMSLWCDLGVMLRTVGVMVRRTGY